MAETTGISWTNSTFNPWIGCTKVGPGCDHCYAESEDARRKWGGTTHWGSGVPRRHTSAAIWNNPHRWNKKRELACGAYARGELAAPPPVHRVFCASLADVFDNEVPDEWRTELWKTIAACPYLTWQLVTKRVGNVLKMVPREWLIGDDWPTNVWLIATVVNQEEFDRDWPKLRAIPAPTRGLSAEPMLGPIIFPSDVRDALHWVIYGGESTQPGAPARPCFIEWIETGLAQCRALGIAPFVKQLGSNLCAGHGPLVAGLYGQGKRKDPELWPTELRVQEFPP